MSWSEARRALARLALLTAAALALAGCGFHLRGDVSYPFSTIYVNATPSIPMGVELNRVLQSATDLKLAAKPAEAQVILDLTSVIDDKSVLSLSSGGRVREYLLIKRVGFNVHDNAGLEWLPQNEITIRRSYTFNESEVLAREAQENRLLREMQTDAVQQILRRLQAAKKPAG
jgi:LPS-assembly lipoprotein